MEPTAQFGNAVPFAGQQTAPEAPQRKPANHLFFALNSDSYTSGEFIDGGKIQ